jgi:hypothetical protein
VGCAAMACPKCAGVIGGELFLKMRRVGCIFFTQYQVCIGRCQPSYESFNCPRGKSLLENCRPFFLKHKFVRALLLPTPGYKACRRSAVKINQNNSAGMTYIYFVSGWHDCSPYVVTQTKSERIKTDTTIPRMIFENEYSSFSWSSPFLRPL